jgi:flagellar secretion chaperone FliS
MSYANQAANYRDLEVLSAPPERLLVLLLDQLVVQLERARIGTERDNLEMQVGALAKVRAIVGELLATLDFEQGGEIAAQLADLYQYMLLELTDIGKRRDVAMMRRLAAIAGTIRDGFAGAAEQLTAVKLSA